MIELYGFEGDETCGAFSVPSPVDRQPLVILASSAGGWDHVSVSRKNRCPNWAEMEHVARLFFRTDETAVQFHVPAIRPHQRSRSLPALVAAAGSAVASPSRHFRVTNLWHLALFWWSGVEMGILKPHGRSRHFSTIWLSNSVRASCCARAATRHPQEQHVEHDQQQERRRQHPDQPLGDPRQQPVRALLLSHTTRLFRLRVWRQRMPDLKRRVNGDIPPADARDARHDPERLARQAVVDLPATAAWQAVIGSRWPARAGPDGARRHRQRVVGSDRHDGPGEGGRRPDAGGGSGNVTPIGGVPGGSELSIPG